MTVLLLILAVLVVVLCWTLKTITTGFLTRLGELLAEDFYRWLLRRRELRPLARRESKRMRSGSQRSSRQNRVGRKRRPFDFPFFPSEAEVRERAESGETERLVAEFIGEGDQQSSRAGGLFTAAVFALATGAIVRSSLGLERWQYGVVIALAGIGLASSLTAQVTRVGKLSLGLPANTEDVLHSYSAMRRKAVLLEFATWFVGATLALLAFFVLIAA